MNLAVADAKKLLIRLVGSRQGIAWDQEGSGFAKSLQASFRPLINTEVKSHLSAAIKQQNIDLVEVDEHLGELSEALKMNILPGFEDYGLFIPEFYLTNVLLPEDDPNFQKLRELHTLSLQKRMAEAEAEVKTTQAEAEARIKVAQRGAILEGQTTETEILKREAERKIIQAQADAQAAQMAGMAEAAVMQAKGYNQKDVLQADVQKAYAEGLGNMGPDVVNGGGGGGSVMGEMLQFGVGMAAMNAMAPQVGDMMKGMNMGSAQGTPAAGTVGSAAASGQTIQCPKCGNTLPANAKFCLECGTKIEVPAAGEMICPSCGQKTPAGKFCMQCGSPLVNKCPNCGTEIPAGGKFCLECGTKI